MTTSAPSHRLAYVLLVLTALFWSGNFVLARAMHAAVPPMTLSFMRWLIAFALLAPFSLRHAWRERALLWQCRGRILALSLLGITAFNSLVYTGVQTTTATNAVLLNSFIPILTVLFGALPESFRAQLQAVFADWQARLAACLRLAQQAGEMSATADAEQLAAFFWIGWEGAVLRAKLAQSAEPLTVFARFFLAGLPR